MLLPDQAKPLTNRKTLMREELSFLSAALWWAGKPAIAIETDAFWGRLFWCMPE